MTEENKDKNLQEEVQPQEEKKKAPAKSSAKKAPAKKAAKKPDQLTMNKLLEIDKKNSQMLEKKVNIFGGEFAISVSAYFKPTKQQEVINQILDFYDLAQDDKYGDKIFDLAPSYMAMMILKEFTSLDVPDSIEDQLATLHVLIDNMALEPLLEVLPEGEFEKMNNLVQDVFQAIDDGIAMM